MPADAGGRGRRGAGSQAQLLPGGHGQERPVLILQAETDRTSVLVGAKLVLAIRVEGIADPGLEPLPLRGIPVHHVAELVIVGRLEGRPHAHVFPRGDLKRVAIGLADCVLAAKAQVAVAGMGQADPGAIVEEPAAVGRGAAGRVKAAFKLETGGPPGAQAFRPLQAPQRVRQAAVQQAALAALPRHPGHGNAGVHNAVQLHAGAAIRSHRRAGGHQAGRRQGGEKCNYDDLCLRWGRGRGRRAAGRR